MGGAGEGGEGWGVPQGLRAAGGGPLAHPPLLLGGRSPTTRPGPPAQLLQAPRARAGRGVHTELLRFMRPRKVDRLCRPVDTELMAERWAPLHRQRCEGVSL